LIRTAEDSADLTTRAEEICGLAFEHVEILSFSNIRITKQGQLQELTLGHLSCDSCENVEYRQRSFSKTGFECRHVQPVAHQYRRLIAIERIHSGTLTTCVCF